MPGRHPVKKAVNVTVDAELLSEAKAAGLNLSAVLDGALRKELHEVRSRQWREENRAAIESMNRYVGKHGLLSDKYRID